MSLKVLFFPYIASPSLECYLVKLSLCASLPDSFEVLAEHCGSGCDRVLHTMIAGPLVRFPFIRNPLDR
jgi:hypothetical protein